jgi:hypothetical protein
MHFVDRGAYEGLDRRLVPGAERRTSKAATETLGSSEAHAIDLYGAPIEHPQQRWPS